MPVPGMIRASANAVRSLVAALASSAMKRTVTALLGLALAVSACGGGADPTFPDDAGAIRVSSDLGLGRERLLFAVGAADGTRLGGPEAEVTVEVFTEGSQEFQRAEAIWTWIVPDAIGLYRVEFEFGTPGIWAAVVIPAEGEALDPLLFQVNAQPFAPALGSPAPAAPTPTLDDLPIEELTTDPEPDLDFYRISLEEALASGRPTVLVFSTPAYCQTAACGPVLDNVKGVAPDHPDVNFIHVEVYTGLTDPDFAPDVDHLAPAVTEEWYSLPSEPWVFVIDADGTIVGRFEGVLDPSELTAILP